MSGTIQASVVKDSASATNNLALDASGNVTVGANLTLSGTAARITGDFTNATVANRVAFQTSTTNGNTVIGLLANGTGTTTALQVNNNSDITAALAFGNLQASSTEVSVQSGIRNAGTYLPMTFYTGGSEVMRIDTSGNVGIGTTGPSFKLTTNYTAPASFSNASGDFLQMWQATGTNAIGVALETTNKIARFVNNNGYATAFNYSGTAEAMRIDTSGNLLVGTTTSNGKLTVSQSSSAATGVYIAQPVGTVASQPTVRALGYSPAYELLNKDSTQNWYFGINDNDSKKLYIGKGYGPGQGIAPSICIDTSDNVLVGYTTSNGAYKLQVNSQIFATSATIATSDANYKTNVTPLSGALNLVQKLNPVSFNWIKHPVHNFDTDTSTVGFLAQEVQAALADTSYVNSIVKQSEVTLPDDTKEKFLGIAEGNMIALLTKALQEAAAKITALEDRITKLESVK